MTSAMIAEFLIKGLVPKLGDLRSRLQSPSARFLDVGSGVGTMSITSCRLLPNLRTVGLEPQDAPLALAHRNIAASRLTDRIELRQQRIENLTESEAFDVAYFP
jgi:2-polyprenyl-3-methyl-5-hydroxy-6-metoxy-1,4-benzoquinol methylase